MDRLKGEISGGCASDLPARRCLDEVGWPTAVGQSSTGDSLQWSESEQASSITNFIAWASGTGYVAEVVYFNYHDYGTNDWYGFGARPRAFARRWGHLCLGAGEPSSVALKSEPE